MIKTDFLDTEYFERLPMIIYTDKGWLIERERRANEFLRRWDAWIEQGITLANMADFKDRNRGMMLLFLRKVLLSGNKKYIPFLKQWSAVDYKKVQEAIAQVIALMKPDDSLPSEERERRIRELAQSLLVRSKDPVILACQDCGGPFFINGTEPECYTEDGFWLPVVCQNCR